MAYRHCSAKAAGGDSIRQRLQWIGYRSLGGNLIERRLSELLTGSKRLPVRQSEAHRLVSE